MINASAAHQFTYDGAVVMIYHVNKGEGLVKHDHRYSHVTFCTAGSCEIRKEHKQVTINKNTKPINLVANEWHEIEALEDNTVFINVFADNKL
jgi:quercetin dioxygenase-like cupin family protein